MKRKKEIKKKVFNGGGESNQRKVRKELMKGIRLYKFPST